RPPARGPSWFADASPAHSSSSVLQQGSGRSRILFTLHRVRLPRLRLVPFSLAQREVPPRPPGDARRRGLHLRERQRATEGSVKGAVDRVAVLDHHPVPIVERLVGIVQAVDLVAGSV